MRAVRGHEGEPRVVEVDEPPGRGEVITMSGAGICASDLGYLALGTEKILGHELAGVRADGTPVVVEGLFGCGDCDYCRSGRNNLCHQSAQMALGIMQDGGMAEQFRDPTEKLVELPPGLDHTHAPLVEPASVAWHGAPVGDAAQETTLAAVAGLPIRPAAAASAQR